MFEELEKINTRPEPFEFYTTSDLWTDEHTSEQMLSFHLNEDIDVSSRNAAFIERSVEWIVSQFNVGVGTKIADSIVAFFKQKENRDIIDRLKEAGVRLAEEVAKPEELPLAGQEFVITGRLEAFSRQEAEAKVKALGGATKDNVTKKTTYLIVGADPGGSKLTRAQSLGTKQLTEEELLHLLEETT